MKNNLPIDIFQINQKRSEKIASKICPQNIYIVCTTESDKVLLIYKKSGSLIQKVKIPKNEFALSLEFSKDSSLLAVMTQSHVFLLNVNNWEFISEIEMDNLKPTVISWSDSKTLAIGTKSGDIIFYYSKNSKKVVAVGKHSKEVISMAWKNNLLLSSSNDSVVVSKETSETSPLARDQGKNLMVDAEKLKWIDIIPLSKNKNLSPIVKNIISKHVFMAIFKEKRSLMIQSLESEEKPIQLVFSSNYGRIIDYTYCKNGNIIIAFQKGFLIKLSLLSNDIKEEIDNEKVFQNSLEIIKFNGEKIFAIGDHNLKVFNFHKFKEIKKLRKSFNPNNGFFRDLEISQNGSFGVAISNKGFLSALLFSLDKKADISENFLVFQSYFNEIKVCPLQKDIKTLLGENFNVNQNQYSIKEENNEIGGLKLLNDHLVTFHENILNLYKLNDITYEQIYSKELPDLILDIKVNNEKRFLILMKKEILLMNLKDEKYQLFKKGRFTKESNPLDIDENFIYLSEKNVLSIYDIYDFSDVFVKQFNFTIKNFFLNSKLFYFLILKNENELYFFNPQEDIILNIFIPTNNIENIIFDFENPKEFSILFKNQKIASYLINNNHYINELSIKIIRESYSFEDFLGMNGEPSFTYIQGLTILKLINGFLISINKKNNLNGIYLSCQSYKINQQSFESLNNFSDKKAKLSSKGSLADLDKEIYLKRFYQNLELLNFEEAYLSSLVIKKKIFWEKLALISLEYLDIKTSKNCFQKLKNISKVYSLEQMTLNKSPEELKGDVAVILNKYNLAKKFYLKGKNPELAIELLRTLQNYSEAVELAKKLNLDHLIASLLIDLADQHYKNDEFIKAFSFYEEALQVKKITPIEVEKVNFGMVKIYLKQGNVIKIRNLVQSINNIELVEELGELSKRLKQFKLASQIFKKIDFKVKSLSCFLEAAKKNDNEVKGLKEYLLQNIDFINEKTILVGLGKFFERTNDLNLAEKLYLKSKDYIGLIKFYLNVQNKPEKAEKIFNEQCKNSHTAANYLAEYFINIEGDKKKAIIYYIMSGRRFEAFQKAKQEDLIDEYCENVKEIEEKECLIIALYYEKKKKYSKSGFYFEKCQEFEKALINYIKAKDYDSSIDLVYKLKSEDLFEFLVQIFSGTTSIYEKESEIEENDIADPIYLFNLYLAFDKFESANKVALVIIDKEAEDGNYKIAHKKSFEIKSAIEKKDKKKISFELKNKFLIYHSYMLVRKLLKLKNHKNAAELLNRVCSYINYFPKHAVQIMTSTVIECTKSKLKYFAFNWSINLCKPEYRNKISPKLKPKIEKIALKVVNKRGNFFSDVYKCPLCSVNIKDEFCLTCINCKNEFCFCMASGKSILAENDKLKVLQCKNCNCFVKQNEFNNFLTVQNNCPLCNKGYTPELFVPVTKDQICQFMNS